MGPNRRELFRRVAASAIAVQSFGSAAPASRLIRAVAFDAFPILDPRPVFALCEQLFPDRGAALAASWRTRQFEYAWLRTLSGQYSDFWQVTRDALVFAAKSVNVDLAPAREERLMQSYLDLRCWPDVPAALRRLKQAGLRLAFLSNMTGKMLEAGIRNSRLDGLFDHVLSTDRVRAYKPDARAYRMALDATGLERGQILFAAFAGWDAAGAKAFGFPTFWVNRQNQPPEELGFAPDAAGSGLADLARFVNL